MPKEKIVWYLSREGKVVDSTQFREVRVWIDGQPPRKSNQRRIVRRGRGPNARPMLIKSKDALAWVESALLQIPAAAKKVGMGSKEIPIFVSFLVFYQDNRPDLSVELILDTLQKAGVISNDRYVFSYVAVKLFSKKLNGVYCVIKEKDKNSNRSIALSMAGDDPELLRLLNQAWELSRPVGEENSATA